MPPVSDRVRNDVIRSVVSGTDSGPLRHVRQALLAKLHQLPTPIPLELVPEPTNEWDSDAIRIELLLEGERFHLGYVKNARTFCEFCQYQHERYPSKGCIGCRRSDHLVRNDTASLISKRMRDYPQLQWVAQALEITGGTGGKANFGCNIEIRCREVHKFARATPAAQQMSSQMATTERPLDLSYRLPKKPARAPKPEQAPEVPEEQPKTREQRFAEINALVDGWAVQDPEEIADEIVAVMKQQAATNIRAEEKTRARRKKAGVG